MNPQDPLANLHPLRQPDAIGWWSLAPGWWALLLLGLACLLLLAYYLWRRRRPSAYPPNALAQLAELQGQYRQDRDLRRYLDQLNALLKSVALCACPRRNVGALSGQQWLQFLNSSFSATEPFTLPLVTAGYEAEPSAIDTEQSYRIARDWIRRHKVPQ